MISIEKIKVEGWEPAIRGMRNPLDSWDKSDSIFSVYDTADVYETTGYIWVDDIIGVGPNDQNLMMNLAKSGTEHAKYRRMIVVWMDITAPLYWWKEFDTYKVGTVANSCSTMHKIHAKEFKLEDFSHEHLEKSGFMDKPTDIPLGNVIAGPEAILALNIDMLNRCRTLYLETKNKKYWWQLIQLLPSSYNQKRTVMLNYEVLANMYRQRRNHKLDEWHVFCDMIDEKMPYSELITLKEEE